MFGGRVSGSNFFDALAQHGQRHEGDRYQPTLSGISRRFLLTATLVHKSCVPTTMQIDSLLVGAGVASKVNRLTRW